ncbi:MAG: hypothetical protein KDD89_16065, partial [Anaerolineales bacterium]|nr:hypothetical protein [Anaerolineales bacterium]
MSDLTPQQLNLGLSSHNNHYLFSNHYLDNILKTSEALRPTWQQAVKHGRDLLTFLQPLYQQERDQLPHYSESQLEEHWFKPILTHLGHTYEGQAKIPALQQRGVKFPDYVFFPDEATRQAAVTAQKSDTYTNDALALGEVKRWDISLDRKLKSGKVSFDDNNPMYQIDYYLRATGLTWGILSNGRVWRLVHKESSYKLDVYFELDLEQALLQADTASGQAIAAFFVLFFQQASFLPDDKGRIFLNDALTASTRYAQELEEDLRDNAYRALEHLIQGFIEPSANNLTAEDLPQIYTSSLYLLYRIIFLFYGERRGLLPMSNPAYAERSLTKLAQDIADQFDKGRTYPPTGKWLWPR